MRTPHIILTNRFRQRNLHTQIPLHLLLLPNGCSGWSATCTRTLRARTEAGWPRPSGSRVWCRVPRPWPPALPSSNDKCRPPIASQSVNPSAIQISNYQSTFHFILHLKNSSKMEEISSCFQTDITYQQRRQTIKLV